ncbi:MAG: hypothetical protein NC402_06250 [Prevotella sp.]|nr:hypothetical protein [Prevotella sp.]MCM1075216.1 hypothetical protein [Ruminococcus sp.]
MNDFYRKLRVGASALFMSLALGAFAQSASVNIEISDITVSDAYMAFTPSSNDFKYCTFVQSKADYDADGGDATAISKKIAYFENMADRYNDTWQSWMAIYQHTGAYGEQAAESLGYLFPETEYVAYAFALDNDKNVIAPLVTKKFTTLSNSVKSDNTFTLSVESITVSGNNRNDVVAKCVPSNDDTYNVKCILKSTVDSYDIDTPEGEKDFINNEMMYPLYQNQIYSGTKELTFANLVEGNEYCLVAFGVTTDLVASTSVTVLPFVCTNQPAVKQESISIEVSDITASNAYMSFTPSSDDFGYCFFISSKADFDAAGGADKAIENQIKYWEQSAEIYQYTWQKVMSWYQHNGIYGEYAYESYGALMSETEYVVYAFAIDNDKNIIAPLVTKTFTTAEAEKSDITFTLSVTSTVPEGNDRNTVNAQCVPSNDDTYNVKCILKENVDKYDLTDSAQEKAFINEYMMYPLYANQIYSGTKNLTFEHLVNGTDYCLVAMGVTTDQVVTTGVTVFPFTCGEKQPDPTVSGTIALNVTDITGMDARIQIIPSNDDFIYFYDVTTPELIAKKGGVEAIPQKFIIEWWQYLAELYEGYTWQDIMKMQCTTGSVDEMASKLTEEGLLSQIYWGQDLVLYAVGFDENGNVVTPTATFDFKTPAPEKSDLTFEFEYMGTEINPDYKTVFTATVDVIPSRDGEPFLANYCTDRVYDQYDEDSDEDMFEFLTYQFYRYAHEFDGWARLQFPDLYINDVAAGKDVKQNYYAIVVGWNEGPTTPIYKFSFNADSTSGVEVTEITDTQVLAGKGVINIFGTFDNAAVLNTAGQLIGGLRQPGSVNVAPGMYIVHYTANGKPASVKVMVK